MTLTGYDCQRCCLRLYGKSIDGFCERCSRDMRESKHQSERDVLAMGHRDQYEAMHIQLGVCLCDKVKAREEAARGRVANEGLENDVSRLKALLAEVLDHPRCDINLELYTRAYKLVLQTKPQAGKSLICKAHAVRECFTCKPQAGSESV